MFVSKKRAKKLCVFFILFTNIDLFKFAKSLEIYSIVLKILFEEYLGGFKLDNYSRKVFIEEGVAHLNLR